MYDLAVEELEELDQFKNAKKKFPLDVLIDRLGIHASRLQIETLLDDIRERDVQLKEIHTNFERYQTKLEKDIGVREKQIQNELMKYDKENVELKELLAKLRKEKEDSINKKWKEIIEEKIQASNDKDGKKYTKLSAIVRGFISRKKLKRDNLFKIAQETGVLVAMRNTRQGE